MLGENIRRYRKEKGLSVNKLSELSSVSLGYISGLENNKVNNPTMDKLNKIASVLGVPVSKLMSTEDQLTMALDTFSEMNNMINEYNELKNSIEYNELLQVDAEVSLLAKKIKLLSEDDKKVIEVLVERLSREDD